MKTSGTNWRSDVFLITIRFYTLGFIQTMATLQMFIVLNLGLLLGESSSIPPLIQKLEEVIESSLCTAKNL